VRRHPNRSFPRTRESSFFITTVSLLKAGSPRARGRADGWGIAFVFIGALAAAPSAAADWRVLAPLGLGMSIEIPGEPVHSDENASPHVLAARNDFVFGTNPSEALYIVSIFDFRVEVREEMTEDDAFSVGVASIGGYCKPTSQTPRPEGPGVAREVVYQCVDDYRVRGRLHLAGERLYRITAGGPGDVADSDDTYRFLDSFRLQEE
jgi:hypothetical protein